MKDYRSQALIYLSALSDEDAAQKIEAALRTVEGFDEVIFDWINLANPREEVATELEEAGWPEVAADVREGVPGSTIARRLRDIGAEDSTAYLIVSQLDD